LIIFKENSNLGDSIFKWINDGLGGNLLGYNYVAAILKDEKIIAGINFIEGQNECILDIYSIDPTWCTREHLAKIFDFAFYELGYVRCSAIVAEDNEHTLKFLAKLGFKQEGIIRKGFDGVKNAVYNGLLREEFENGKCFR
jgi:RimJ/RimL family protein N-acetyltransferase